MQTILKEMNSIATQKSIAIFHTRMKFSLQCNFNVCRAGEEEEEKNNQIAVPVDRSYGEMY